VIAWAKERKLRLDWGSGKIYGSFHGPGFVGLNAEKPVEPGNSDLCFVWPGPIEEVLDHLDHCGVPVVAGPLTGEAGARGVGQHVYFRDPDGSLLEFVSYR
jgi:catechol 2,3-dioxygenase-like lactoylglutathione lyase family enzyme